MDLDYLYYKKMVKSKRQRERNWDRNEKKALLRLVQKYRTIIDNKGNDNVWVRRKNAAWDAIQRGMVAEGFRRGAKSIRQQWTRTKCDAKRKTKIKRENSDTDQMEDDPQAILPIEHTDEDPLDCIIKNEECEPQEMIFNPNTCDEIITPKDDIHEEDCLNDNLVSVDSILNSIPSPNFDHAESSGIGSTTPSNHGSATDPPLPPPRPAERKLMPRGTGSRNVLHARLRQIEEECVQSSEIHALEVTHRQQIHLLRVKQIREQIEQQRQLFEAQMMKIKTT